jgi:hypothetical protein
MSNGFLKVEIKSDEVDKLLKKYKKIKKYMKSSLYEVMSIDKTETIVSDLINENLSQKEDDPPATGEN